MGILRNRMIDEMTLRNFAPTTQQSYLYSVTRLAKYYKRPQISSTKSRSAPICCISSTNGSCPLTP